MDKSQDGINKRLGKEILAMVAEDQKMYISGKVNKKAIRRRTEKMRKIIQKFGWPGESLVGKKAADRAWLIVQHSDHDLEFQKQALNVIKGAARRGEVEKRQVAYLTDRILVNSGRYQTFGTQFYFYPDGSFKPRPTKNSKFLDQRRKRYGLEPFAYYLKAMRQKNKSKTRAKAKNV